MTGKMTGVTGVSFSVFERTVTGNDVGSKIKSKENKQHSKTAPLPSVCDQILKSSVFSVYWRPSAQLFPSFSLHVISVTFNVKFPQIRTSSHIFFPRLADVLDFYNVVHPLRRHFPFRR